MPSEEKMNKMEEMFIKTSKPNNLIDEIDEITSIACMYDSTPQSMVAFELATELVKNLHLPLKIFVSGDYYLKMKTTANDIRYRQEQMTNFVEEHTKEEGLDIDIELLSGKKIQRILKMMDEKVKAEEKLSRMLINKLSEEKYSIVVTGIPMMRKREEKGDLGYYLIKLLKEHKIHSNYLIIPDGLIERGETLLGISNYRQKEDSVIAIIRRAISLNLPESEIQIVGIVENNTIETVANSELVDEVDDLNIKMTEVRNRLQSQFEDRISCIKINEKFDIKMSHEVVSGILSTALKITLDKFKPKIVMIRNITKLEANLDHNAETIARIALSEGYPVLLLWD